ncbi:metal ABC transporter permease [Rouxiella sp. WC2420]|uniref:Metal ABC transporter permease n=1 Tax=Rouxiella sp. WC2420 TaxID=3234145 RepID=A0AB39VJP3_9GAMM
MNLLVEPGFFTSAPVQTALIVGGGTAIVSGVVGVFTVIRGQSFAGHALADVSSAGGALSFLLGINPLIGLLGMALVAAIGMEMIDIRRARERDLMTGIVLGAGLGLSALLLYFDVTTHSTTGAAITVMFGSMFAIPPAIIPLALSLGGGALLAIFVIYRPLLLSSLDKELAEVMGINTRRLAMFYLMLLSLAVTLAAMTVGAVLSTALLIGPAATALRLTKRPLSAMLAAVIIGLVATWGGILLAYNSYYWTPGHGWPVSFFIVALIFVAYLAATHLIRIKGR